MTYCLTCKHLSPVGSTHCLGCGGSFGGKRCSCGHLSLSTARCCTACGSHALGLYAPSVPVGSYIRHTLAVVSAAVPLFFLEANLHAALRVVLAAWELILTLVPVLVFGLTAYWLLGQNRRIVVPLLNVGIRIANGLHRVLLESIEGVARHARASDGGGD